MKITTFDLVITPPVGTCVAGYGPQDESWEIHDDLMCNGLLMDDGEKKAAILGFDLIGMDAALIHEIRTGCAAILGSAEADIILSCTHTHGGPHTRSNWKNDRIEPYCTELTAKVIDAVQKAASGSWTDCDVYFYSDNAKVNINRRYKGPENACRMLFLNRTLEPIADGPVDTEIGMIFFRDKKTCQPVETLINYAAHPLASHCRGLGGHAVTADYPALIRKWITEDSRSHCTFVSGACGNQFPIDSEIGWTNLDSIAKPIVRQVLHGMVDAFVNPQKFLMKDAKLKTMIAPYTTKPREGFPDEHRRKWMQGLSEYNMELQLLAIGDICFVGVPGELCVEPGLEIKWHSPFRRAYVLYNSTDYVSYICAANDLVSGGYEANMQQIESKAALKLVNVAVDAMFELYGQDISVPAYP